MMKLPWMQLIIVFIYITLQLLLQQGVAQITNQIYRNCTQATYSSGSSYSTNINVVIAALSTRASQYYYYHINATEADPSNSTSFAFGLYQCRSDISLSDCASCISYIFTTSWCGVSSIGMRMQVLGCYVHYNNSDVLTYDNSLIDNSCSSSSNTNSLYQSNLALALNNTAMAAASTKPVSQNSVIVYFNASSVGTTNSTTAYALAQCLFFLTPSQCSSCLSSYSGVSTVCSDSTSGYFYYASCFYLFDDTSLLISIPSTTATSPPTALPQGQLSPPPSIVASTIENKKSNIPMAVGIAIGVSVLLLATVVVLVLRHRHKHKKAAGLYSMMHSLAGNLVEGAKNFPIRELQEATNFFHADNKLGQGGFGPVFKGKLKNGTDVAIKILSANSRQGTAEFMNEVNLITNVRHRNLIQLLGCCMHEQKRLLVYEYLPNRSLDLHLFERDLNVNRKALDWNTRFNIIIRIARGLWYLHEGSPVRIVHRDIKPSNILLDNDLNPKIADFGLARLVHDEITHVVTRVAGTMGYMAPEYAMGGHLSEKADVYSYGLVALQIVSGRKVREHAGEQDQHQHLLEWAWSLYERQEQMMMVDPKMMEIGPVDDREVARVVHVALLCTQTNPVVRPMMSQVCTMLSSQSAILEQPTKPTTVLGIMSPLQAFSSASILEQPTKPTTVLGMMSPLQAFSSASASSQKTLVPSFTSTHYNPLESIDVSTTISNPLDSTDVPTTTTMSNRTICCSNKLGYSKT